MENIMLQLKSINMTFGAHTIFKNFDLTIQKEEFVILVGSNGSGKTTLLNIISGLLKPDKGTIILDDRDITNISASTRSQWIAKVTQDPKNGTCKNMTIFENMTLALTRGQTRWPLLSFNAHRKTLFQDKLAILNMGLENRLDDLVKNLSGGQRQALSIIMMFLTDAKVILLDEITAALDPNAADQIMQITNNIVRQEKRTCIMITHSKEQIQNYGDCIVEL